MNMLYKIFLIFTTLSTLIIATGENSKIQGNTSQERTNLSIAMMSRIPTDISGSTDVITGMILQPIQPKCHVQ